MIYDVIVFDPNGRQTTDTVTGSRRRALNRMDELDGSNRPGRRVAAVLDRTGRRVERDR